jgi:hypothetical protein
MCGNYSREKTIQRRKLYEEIRYVHVFNSKQTGIQSKSKHNKLTITLKIYERNQIGIFIKNNGKKNIILKVHICWESPKILRDLHLTFVLCSASQKLGENLAKFCGLLRIYELYLRFANMRNKHFPWGYSRKPTNFTPFKVGWESMITPSLDI